MNWLLPPLIIDANFCLNTLTPLPEHEQARSLLPDRQADWGPPLVVSTGMPAVPGQTPGDFSLKMHPEFSPRAANERGFLVLRACRTQEATTNRKRGAGLFPGAGQREDKPGDLPPLQTCGVPDLGYNLARVPS